MKSATSACDKRLAGLQPGVAQVSNDVRVAARSGSGYGVLVQKLRIDVWSDIACPWCYVGKRHLEAALARFPHPDAVEVVWRAFELDPSAPREREHTASYADRLAKKYGTSAREAQTRIDRMTDIARADGLV